MCSSTCAGFNKAPTVPVISGRSAGVVGVPVTFKATAPDPENDSVAFHFDWGDSSTLAWADLFVSDKLGFRQASSAGSGTAGTIPARFSHPASMFLRQGRESAPRPSN